MQYNYKFFSLFTYVTSFLESGSKIVVLHQTRAINFLPTLKGNFNDIYIYLAGCVDLNNGNKATGDIKISSTYSLRRENIKRGRVNYSALKISTRITAIEVMCNNSNMRLLIALWNCLGKFVLIRDSAVFAWDYSPPKLCTTGEIFLIEKCNKFQAMD